MTRAKFHVTYEIVTPESAESGEAAESGFAMPGGWRFDMSALWGEAAAKVKADHALGLREAVGMVSGCEDSGHWFTESDSRHDYRTGAETRYSLHPPENITPASYARVARLLGCKT